MAQRYIVTRDVDVCYRFNEANLERIRHALDGLHPACGSRPDLPLDFSSEQCASLKDLYLKTDLGALDCLGEVLGVGNSDDVLKQSIEVELPFGRCRVFGYRWSHPSEGSDEP